jgi:hypothetical protein
MIAEEAEKIQLRPPVKKIPIPGWAITLAALGATVFGCIVIAVMRNLPEAGTATEPEFIQIGTPTRVGDIMVVVVDAAVENVPLKDSLGDVKYSDDDKPLVIHVGLINATATKKLAYSGFPKAKLTDNFGNDYAQKTYHTGFLITRVRLWPVDSKPKGADVYPHEPVLDCFTFKRPISTIQYLILEIRTNPLGQPGTIRFKIPREEITGSWDTSKKRTEREAEEKNQQEKWKKEHLQGPAQPDRGGMIPRGPYPPQGGRNLAPGETDAQRKEREKGIKDRRP